MFDKKNFWAQQKLGCTNNLGGSAPECPPWFQHTAHTLAEQTHSWHNGSVTWIVMTLPGSTMPAGTVTGRVWEETVVATVGKPATRLGLVAAKKQTCETKSRWWRHKHREKKKHYLFQLRVTASAPVSTSLQLNEQNTPRQKVDTSAVLLFVKPLKPRSIFATNCSYLILTANELPPA